MSRKRWRPTKPSHGTLQIRWVHPHLGVAKFLCASLMTEGDSLQVDDVMGDMFKNAAVTDVIGGCPKCGEWQAQISFCLHVCMNADPALSRPSLDALGTETRTMKLAGNAQAYYFEMQIRSADEPATRFYQCAASQGQCGHKWRED